MPTSPLRQISESTTLVEDDLIGLVTSRICHDLVSPIGAIDNGVELMTALSGTPHSAEMGLIGESARSAGLKLRLFRLAFGVASPDATSRAGDLNQIFGGSFNRPRLRFTWVSEPRDMARPEAKLAALALLCADSAMPFGGHLQFSTAGDTLTLTMQGERLRWQNQLWQALTTQQPFADVGAGNVQFPMARLLADQLGRGFTLRDDAQGKILTV